jgi:hypothetical protein
MNNIQQKFSLGSELSNLNIQADIPKVLENGQIVAKQIEGGLSALNEALALIAKGSDATVAEITNARYRVEINRQAVSSES